MTFGESKIFETDKGTFSNFEAKCAVTKIGEQDVINSFTQDVVRAYVTRDGKLHYQGLIDKLG